MGIFLSQAYGQAAASATAAAKPTLIETLFPFAIILVFFWLFLGRPQQKKLKEHHAFLAGIKRGDQVLTTGGIHGEVTNVSEKIITLQIADNVRIKVARNHIIGSATKEGNP